MLYHNRKESFHYHSCEKVRQPRDDRYLALRRNCSCLSAQAVLHRVGQARKVAGRSQSLTPATLVNARIVQGPVNVSGSALPPQRDAPDLWHAFHRGAAISNLRGLQRLDVSLAVRHTKCPHGFLPCIIEPP